MFLPVLVCSKASTATCCAVLAMFLFVAIKFLKSSLQGVPDMEHYRNKAKEVAMIAELKAVAARSSDTLLEDAIGVVSLFALLLAGLFLPSLI